MHPALLHEQIIDISYIATPFNYMMADQLHPFYIIYFHFCSLQHANLII
jgi:hypothetical protein